MLLLPLLPWQVSSAVRPECAMSHACDCNVVLCILPCYHQRLAVQGHFSRLHQCVCVHGTGSNKLSVPYHPLMEDREVHCSLSLVVIVMLSGNLPTHGVMGYTTSTADLVNIILLLCAHHCVALVVHQLAQGILELPCMEPCTTLKHAVNICDPLASISGGPSLALHMHSALTVACHGCRG